VIGYTHNQTGARLVGSSTVPYKAEPVPLLHHAGSKSLDCFTSGKPAGECRPHKAAAVWGKNFHPGVLLVAHPPELPGAAAFRCEG
jgi:hypothetical protein